MAKVFVATVVIDLVYEVIVFRWVCPLQSLIVAAVLALLPYLLIRGAFNRIVGLWRVATGRSAGDTPTAPRRV
jgi:hypothetical protein